VARSRSQRPRCIVGHTRRAGRSLSSEVSLPHRAALPGASDCAPRVVNQHYGAHKLALTVELLVGTTVSLPIRINLVKPPKLSITGAELHSGELLVKASSGHRYLSQHIELSWFTR
jgi:hypothetical protein